LLVVIVIVVNIGLIEFSNLFIYEIIDKRLDIKYILLFIVSNVFYAVAISL